MEENPSAKLGICLAGHTLRSKNIGAACYPPAVVLVLFAEVCSKEGTMQWYTYVAYFFGGAFLVNAVPHFTNGVSGRRFPTPFASPPGKGESSPTVNVLWGTLNLAIGYLLVCRVGEFNFHQTSGVLIFGAGGLLMGIQLAGCFGRAYGAQ